MLRQLAPHGPERVACPSVSVRPPVSTPVPEGALFSARSPEGALLSARSPEGALLSARSPEGALRHSVRTRVMRVGVALVGFALAAGAVSGCASSPRAARLYTVHVPEREAQWYTPDPAAQAVARANPRVVLRAPAYVATPAGPAPAAEAEVPVAPAADAQAAPTPSDDSLSSGALATAAPAPQTATAAERMVTAPPLAGFTPQASPLLAAYDSRPRGQAPAGLDPLLQQSTGNDMGWSRPSPSHYGSYRYGTAPYAYDPYGYGSTYYGYGPSYGWGRGYRAPGVGLGFGLGLGLGFGVGRHRGFHGGRHRFGGHGFHGHGFHGGGRRGRR